MPIQPLEQANAELNIIISAAHISKSFGPLQAVREMTLEIAKGEVVGLCGANGAGKSTFMKILSGVLPPDSGELRVESVPVEFDSYGPRQAARLGVRVVHQELSLCTNLTVAENFYLEQSQQIRAVGWQKSARRMAGTILQEVFPGTRISPSVAVADLTIAERQIVEIARAASDPLLKLLILDEPTSSLNGEQTEKLLQFIRSQSERGLSFVFISHRLKEVLSVSDRLVVMRDGVMVAQQSTAETTEEQLVALMGGGDRPAIKGRPDTRRTGETTFKGRTRMAISQITRSGLDIADIRLNAGEIVGIAGLEGGGQERLLQELYRQSRRRFAKGVRVDGSTIYVSGDRDKEGVFPFWSIAQNIHITEATSRGLLKYVSPASEEAAVRPWYDRLKIKAADAQDPLVSLSGGNQQKALVARALAADADIVLLADPTRGVDIETKRDLYVLFREAATAGKLVIWYSSEDEELEMADRVLVMASGQVVRELQGVEITRDAIVKASFVAAHRTEDVDQGFRHRLRMPRLGGLERSTTAFAALLLVLIALGIENSSSLSGYGLSLLLGSATPLVLAGLAQMFIVTASDIDLGIGNYMAFVNVVSATVLLRHSLLGWLMLVGGIVGYGLMGALIHQRRVPSVVVTLGASFIWYGLAVSLAPVPEGSSPAWLTAIFNVTVPGIPEAITMCVVIGVVTYFVLMRSKYGTVLRGFGNNILSISNAGWSALKARVALYVLAGVFGTFAGLAVTATTTSSDANGTSAYTLLTVATVVMGGGELVGGVVEPIGVVFGALTLSLVGSLLGFMGVNSNYQSGVQGLMLLLILAIRLLQRKGAKQS